MRLMLLAAAAATAMSSIASADPAASQAAALFAKAQSDMEEGKRDQACGEFEQSLALERAIGTMLNVGRCLSTTKPVEAAAVLNEAVQVATKKNQPAYVQSANDLLNLIAPIMPHLTIVLTDSPSGIAVTIDGKDVAVATLGDVQIDPGSHVLRVNAPGHPTYEAPFQIDKSEHKKIVVAAFDPGHPRSTDTTEHRGDRTTDAGRLIAAGGVGVLVTGATVGVLAKLRYNDALKNDCGGNTNNCTPDGLAKTSDARSFGNLGTYVGITGAVVGAAGIAIWLGTRHHHGESAEPTGVTFAPMLAPGEAGAMAFARF